MPFMVFVARKAKSLNSCPGETNCRNAWHRHSQLRDVFQSFQNIPAVSCAQGSNQCYSKTFDILVLCYVLPCQAQKKGHQPSLCQPFFPTLKTQEFFVRLSAECHSLFHIFFIKEDPLCVSLFSFIYNVTQLHPSEQSKKALASECSEHIFSCFFYFQPELMSLQDLILYLIICSMYSL